MGSAFLPESRPLFSAQTPIRKWVLLPKGIHHIPSLLHQAVEFDVERGGGKLRTEKEAMPEFTRRGSQCCWQSSVGSYRNQSSSKSDCTKKNGYVPPEVGQTWSPLQEDAVEAITPRVMGWGGDPPRPCPAGYQSLLIRRFSTLGALHIYLWNTLGCPLKSESVSHSVMSDSVIPWLLCPWDSLGKNIGVASHSLLHGTFPTQDWTLLSGLAGRFFTIWATRTAPWLPP